MVFSSTNRLTDIYNRWKVNFVTTESGRKIKETKEPDVEISGDGSRLAEDEWTILVRGEFKR